MLTIVIVEFGQQSVYFSVLTEVSFSQSLGDVRHDPPMLSGRVLDHTPLLLFLVLASENQNYFPGDIV